MRNLLRKKQRRLGIALLVIISAIVVLSFAVGELSFQTSSQMSRVRNSYDRMNAVYLARSSLNLARFFIILDASIDERLGGEASDRKGDYWDLPIDFPIPIEILQAFQAEVTGEAPALDSNGESTLKSCGEFFDDFQGSSRATIQDLSKKLHLNDMALPEVQEVFSALLSPDLDFIDSLNARNILREEVIQQVRDFIDEDAIENDSKLSEEDPYRNAELDYKPKNRPFMLEEELKLVPSIDSELFEYLQPLTSAYYFIGRRPPSKINLNTVEQEVFQALLKGVSDPVEIAADFIQDREETGRIYTNKGFAEELENIGIGKDQIQMNLLSGEAEAFLVKSQATVGDVQVELEAVLKKTSKTNDRQPIARIRISP